MDSSEVVLSVEALTKHFPVRGGRFGRAGSVVRALDGVSFELRRGETLGIVGESGCGKSTLARTVVGLEKPTSGAVRFRGEDVHALAGRRRSDVRRRVQIVLQDPYSSLNPRRTVRDTLLQPFRIHPSILAPSRRGARVVELAELVGLNPDHLDRYPFQFSGGQRQRIGIARALALDPEVVVCDEPVSALDVSVQAQVVNLLQRLQAELGLAYVFIAHDLSIVRHISDRIGVMYLGRLAELGERRAVYDHPAHPYTKALLSAVPVPDPQARGSGERLLLPGDPPSPVDPPSGCRFRTRCWQATDLCATAEPPLAAVPGPGPREVACHFPLVTQPTSPPLGAPC
ncbi:ABC transporter ATP-binding protein [Auraticoccus monumenti]|uniref:Peptide/nickel transport system ATP-binding protein n=1 Tax=Auraticoccus monumenti TaxID=675864 RepID=A0A1G6TXD5_9ACTN|nr:ABC transporter ATP-binding protein [Auraticoccus monumenti]SDD33584.1 peptide/nickel transport system ATP-binding protein [Auraticoccus monumenti]